RGGRRAAPRGAIPEQWFPRLVARPARQRRRGQLRPRVVAARPAHRRAVRPGADGARDARGVVMAVIERAAKIVNPLGMHARPAAECVRLAGRFKSAVEVQKDDLTVNGKSIMGVMMLAAECGSSLIIKVDGEDA